MTVAPRARTPGIDERPASEASPGRTAALVLVALTLIFAAGTAAGFVYAHEPSAPELRTSLVPPPATPDSIVRGTLSSVTPDAIELSNATGAQRLQISPATPIEELAPLDSPIPEGAPVNVGGNRTESGFVITGVVVLPGGAR